MTGVAMGTPDYAPPEVFDSTKTPDHRADLYAVGVMLYQMLTGRLPRGHLKPPSSRPELDPRLDEIVSRALQPEPDDRYPMATAFRTALDPVITSPMTPRGNAAPEEIEHADAGRGRLAALIVLGGLAAYLMKGGGEEATKTIAEVKPASVAGEAAPVPVGAGERTGGQRRRKKQIPPSRRSLSQWWKPPARFRSRRSNVRRHRPKRKNRRLLPSRAIGQTRAGGGCGEDSCPSSFSGCCRGAEAKYRIQAGACRSCRRSG